MKPSYQTDTSETGNCLQHCIASLLEVDADEIPNFTKWDGDWFGSAQTWMAKRDLCFVYVALHPNTPWFPMPGEPWAIFVGLSESKITHAVVGRCEGENFAVVHDPHPNQAGIDAVDAVLFICPLDPATLGARLDKPKILSATVIPSGVKRIHKFRDNGR